MKKFLLLTCAWGMTLQGQDPNWEILHTGHLLDYGRSKLIVHDRHVYIFNSPHSILSRSEDGGATWERIVIPSDSSFHEYLDISFSDALHGFVAGYDGSRFSPGGIRSVIKRTTDGGLTWAEASNGLNNGALLTHVNFFNNREGIAFGTGQMQTHRFVTNDYGMNWTYLPNEANMLPVIDMHQVNVSSIAGQHIVVGGIGYYFHFAVSFDGGKNWVTRHRHSSSSVNSLKFFDGANGVLQVNDSIFFTEDAALTFTAKRKFPFSTFIKSFEMLDMQKGFFCTDHEIYYTDDGGLTWQLSYSNPGLQLASVRAGGSNIYAMTVGSDVVLKLDISGLTVALPLQPLNTFPAIIYPSPARSEITIENLKGENVNRIVISDNTGRTVKHIDSPQSLTVNVSDLSSGVYFVEAIAKSGIYKGKFLKADK